MPQGQAKITAMSPPIDFLALRLADQRGRTTLGWLDSYHTFAFGGYRDADFTGFRSLRVINDDTIAPGAGFSEHPHRDMEILTWVLAGSLAHRDSLGNVETLSPGELQTMTAGTGIRHSEFNASQTDPVHFLQMWVLPGATGHAPRYQQKRFDETGRENRWQLIASRDARDGSLPINQDATLSVVELSSTGTLTASIETGRYGWLHVATGSLQVKDQTLTAGDGLALTGPIELLLAGVKPTQVLLFDLG